MMERGPASDSAGGRHVLTSIGVNVIASMAVALCGLAATAYIARAVSVADFGRIVLLLTVITAFAIFEGQRPVVIHRIASGDYKPGPLFKASAKINAIMVAVTIVLMVGGFFATGGAGISLASLAVLAATIVFFFVAMQFWTFLDAEEDTVFTGIARSLAWLLVYASFALLAYHGASLFFYSLALLGMHLFLCAVLIIRFIRKGFFTKYRPRVLGPSATGLLLPAMNNIIFNTCAVTINVADRAVVGSILGAQLAGLYSGPSELALRATGLVRAAVQVILPWAARLSSSSQQKMWLLAVTLTMLLAGSGAAVALYWRDFFAVFLLGESFRVAGDFLGIFAVGIVVSTLGYASIVQFNARGDFRTQRQFYAIGAVIVVAGSIWGATSDNLLLVAVAFLCGRSVDLFLLAIILAECEPEARNWFLAIFTSMVLALAGAWMLAPTIASILLVICYGFAYGFWRRVKSATP